MLFRHKVGVEGLEFDLLGVAGNCRADVVNPLGEKAPAVGRDLVKEGDGDAEGDLALPELAEVLAGETVNDLCGLGFV